MTLIRKEEKVILALVKNEVTTRQAAGEGRRCDRRRRPASRPHVHWNSFPY